MAECFRDMTFCRFWEKCAGGEGYFRALTEEVGEQARRFGAPVCQFIEPPKECYREKK